MKTLCLSCIAAIILAGCSSAPIQTYRPAGQEELWSIDGVLNPGLIDSEITIRIDGEAVIVDKLSDFQNTAEFSGKYKTYNITASCSRINDWRGQKVQCIVFVNNERAATLQF